jgi:hypothetical protein
MGKSLASSTGWLTELCCGDVVQAGCNPSVSHFAFLEGKRQREKALDPEYVILARGDFADDVCAQKE